MTDVFATEVDLPAPPEVVFRHLTDPALMIRWMGQHAALKPVPGGAFEVDINGVPVRGRYLVVDRWESADAYNAFANERREEYMRRVDDTRFMYDQELRFGTFENVWA